jgi:hypothetical protein
MKAQNVFSQILANGIVEAKRPEFLEQCLSDYRNAASEGHKKFKWCGVWEATGGAFVWSVLLIAFFVIIAIQGGADVIEICRKAVGTH